MASDASDPFGVGMVSGLYGAGTTLAYFLTLLALYIDSLAWLYRNRKHSRPVLVKSRTGSRITKTWALKLPKEEGEGYDESDIFELPDPIDASEAACENEEPEKFGFNMNVLLVLLYYWIIFGDLVSRARKQEEATEFASFLTATAFYTATSLTTTMMLLWLTRITLIIHNSPGWKNSPEIIRLGVAHPEFLLYFFSFSAVLISKAYVNHSGLPIRGSNLPFLSDIELYASMTLSPNNATLPFTNADIRKTVAGRVAVVCRRSNGGLGILGFFFMTAPMVVFALSSSSLLFSILFPYYLQKSSEEWGFLGKGLARTFLSLLYLVAAPVWLGCCGYWLIMGGNINDEVDVNVAIILKGFRFLTGAPGSFSEVDQIYASIASTFSLIYSCYRAYQSVGSDFWHFSKSRLELFNAKLVNLGEFLRS